MAPRRLVREVHGGKRSSPSPSKLRARPAELFTSARKDPVPPARPTKPGADGLCFGLGRWRPGREAQVTRQGLLLISGPPNPAAPHRAAGYQKARESDPRWHLLASLSQRRPPPQERLPRFPGDSEQAAPEHWLHDLAIVGGLREKPKDGSGIRCQQEGRKRGCRLRSHEALRKPGRA